MRTTTTARRATLIFVVASCCWGIAHFCREFDGFGRRQLSFFRNIHAYVPPAEDLMHNLPPYAEEWCVDRREPPLDYHACDDKTTLSTITMAGGLTNGLKFLLLAALKSFEENRCLHVIERPWHMRHRNDKSQELDSFLQRYFEPIGLLRNDSFVNKMIREGKAEDRGHFQQTWKSPYFRRTHGRNYTIPSLGYYNVEGPVLKRHFLKRMWRLLPHVRDYTCRQLGETHGLHDEYLSFSVRRGDKKTIEGREYTDMQRYIEAAERAIPTHFNNVVPRIFVATDDCTVLPELRGLKPDWTFVSECDRNENGSDGQDHHQQDGFVIQDMLDLTVDQTDQHSYKFFVELYAMAISKYYIGVSYTNVAWWVFFMRRRTQAFELIDLDQPSQLHYNTW